jgi:hypothetical protein
LYTASLSSFSYPICGLYRSWRYQSCTCCFWTC